MPSADGSDPEEHIPAAQVTSTPPRYSPYSPGRPGRAPSPRSEAPPDTRFHNLHNHPTPANGLTADELKGMPKEWNSAAKIAHLVEDALNAFTKENVPSGEVLDWLKETFKSTVNTSIPLRLLMIVSESSAIILHAD
jgi:hypothetical protein